VVYFSFYYSTVNEHAVSSVIPTFYLTVTFLNFRRLRT
jgi:hypothetical protein